MALTPSASSFGYKFYHVLPFFVIDDGGQIYYVVHRLQSISRVTIHLWVHKHPITDGKCKEFMDEIRRLITNEMNYMFDAKIFAISLSVSKTFLARHLFDDCSNGIVELLNNEQLEHI
jgi:hypothetical protein